MSIMSTDIILSEDWF